MLTALIEIYHYQPFCLHLSKQVVVVEQLSTQQFYCNDNWVLQHLNLIKLGFNLNIAI